jgi:sporulation protein YlmC with PRC-barrel domain
VILKYSSIIGSLVAELRDQTKIGKVSEVIIDKEKLEIAALAVEQSFIFFSKSKFVLKMDIISLLKDGVIITDQDSIIDLKGSVKLEKLVKGKNFGIGQRVFTDNGKMIGTVYDYLVETNTLSITKLYVKHLVKEFIIPVEKILSFEGKVITIKDSYNASRIERAAITESMVAS